ncbi:hypothetical protein FHL15_006478 [Xylaria flabelliformis]|uniref:Uncharacterized protein n=1 Tax=Xylaria flabelliformis TaxID=2512241 RepID=A0A553HX75_9PEZI|nr:hypothetical protein FHL15_006478 [Xylaria flabelliformis]
MPLPITDALDRKPPSTKYAGVTRTTEPVMLKGRSGYFAAARHGMARLRHVASTDALQTKPGSLDDSDLGASYGNVTHPSTVIL